MAFISINAVLILIGVLLEVKILRPINMVGLAIMALF